MCAKQLKDVTDVDALISYLKDKGESHTYYYHYTSWDSFLKIYENSSFLLTRGNSLNINDQQEAFMKGAKPIWDKTYIGSFAYGYSENMAMWGLYGQPASDAIRIAIPKTEMLNWIHATKEVYIWDGAPIDSIRADVSLNDIVYVSGEAHGDNLLLSHQNKTLETVNVPALNGVDTFPQMTGYIKNAAWRYENEVRIRIELPYVVDGNEKIMIKIPDSVLSSIMVMEGPSFDNKSDDIYNFLHSQGRTQKSAFTGLLKYRSLCSLCAHGAFEKK